MSVPDGPHLSFRDMVAADLPLLARWLSQPHVHRFWQEAADLDSVTTRYQPSLDGRDPTYLAVLQADGTDIGMFQGYRLGDNLDWYDELLGVGVDVEVSDGSMDYLIGEPSRTGRGIGSAAIALFSRLCFQRYVGIARLVVTVGQDNPASWRALENAGYRRDWEGEFPDPVEAGDEGPQFGYVMARPLDLIG